MKKRIRIWGAICILAAFAVGCANTKAEETAEKTKPPAATVSVEDEESEMEEPTAGVGENLPADAELLSVLPKYTYTGGNPYIETISAYFAEDRGEKEAEAVYIPVPVILKVEEGRDETLVYGCFWDFWYEKEEKNLFCINGSGSTGRLHLEREKDSYKVTAFERARDGGYFSEDLKAMCGEDRALYEEFLTKETREDRREELRRELINRYAEDNGLEIESYQDFGWEPVLLSEEGSWFRKEGKEYQKVKDLKYGGYRWCSVLTKGDMILDDHGHERTDYYSQIRSFESLDGRKKSEVRRWDNLCYSAGEYLIFEYDGVIHVSRDDDLYHPVLSYDSTGTYGIITKVPGGYMIANDWEYTVSFYDENFQLTRKLEGYRMESVGDCYHSGLSAVRDMKTGLMGFINRAGDLEIPCEYGSVSDFSNGYASVLTDAAMIPFTEDGGTVAMFDAEGGQWGIIDTDGNYVVEPSEKYENPGAIYRGERKRYFSEVRKDKTVDFLEFGENHTIIETIRIGI